MSDGHATGPFPDPVLLTGTELGESTLPLEELQGRALAYLRANAQGRTVVNALTGWTIGIGRRGINKTLNHAARREHVQSVPALVPLLERAALVFTEANRDPDEVRSVPLVHTFAALLTIGREEYRVRLIVKETGNGRRFYDHDLSATADTTTEPADSARAAHLPKEGATNAKPAGSLPKLRETRTTDKDA